MVILDFSAVQVQGYMGMGLTEWGYMAKVPTLMLETLLGQSGSLVMLS